MSDLTASQSAQMEALQIQVRNLQEKNDQLREQKRFMENARVEERTELQEEISKLKKAIKIHTESETNLHKEIANWKERAMTAEAKMNALANATLGVGHSHAMPSHWQTCSDPCPMETELRDRIKAGIAILETVKLRPARAQQIAEVARIRLRYPMGDNKPSRGHSEAPSMVSNKKL